MTNLNNSWEHSKTVLDGERFEITGINIWDHEWKNIGETIHVKDPQYKQDFTFAVYEITSNAVTVKFAAGEFSNCVWGIYLNSETENISIK